MGVVENNPFVFRNGPIVIPLGKKGFCKGENLLRRVYIPGVGFSRSRNEKGQKRQDCETSMQRTSILSDTVRIAAQAP
jgi:hypothetical protein